MRGGRKDNYTLSPVFYFYSRGFQRMVSITWELIKNASFQDQSDSQILTYVRITWRVWKTDCWAPPETSGAAGPGTTL